MPPASSDGEEFRGNERFSLQRRLGSGGFGVVYQAYDKDRGAVVALKALRQRDATALYRFKREFRLLSDVAHHNLINLYELLSDGEQWFFTMEMVPGVNFLAYVRGRSAPRQLAVAAPPLSVDATVTQALLPPEAPAVVGAPEWTPPPDAGGPMTVALNLERLRWALRQLAEGVSALHTAGQLHRDLKPSNVLVTPEDRVVILDFGLATELAPSSAGESLTVVGTPAYMSPEQAMRNAANEASDWYSVGVMIYEALSGQLPFTGSMIEVLINKQKYDPAPPSSLVPGVPADLDQLCRELMRRDPAQRPTGREILRRLGSVLTSAPPAASRAESLLVGRENHLRSLHEALDATRQGKAVLVRLHGNSGMGKSALAQRFLEEVRARGLAVVLAGRCYERESVPYKALDSMVDALSQYLRRLTQEQVEALLPRDVAALSRLFPVLLQVGAIAEAPRKTLEVPDAQELRRRAFNALRELLARLSDRSAVVLFIDDLQWGDADSAALAAEILRPPDAPALLWIAGYRTEEAERSPFLVAMKSPEFAGATEVAVGELAPEDSRALALKLLGGDRAANLERAEAIARESGGNPFFVHELACYGQAGQKETRLEEVIHSRLARLSEPERVVLEVVAVAGQPVELAVARQAALLETQEVPVLKVLRAEHLVRTRGLAVHDEIETYHDRIRETIVAHMPPERLRERHLRLAQALEASGRADPETLAVHYQACGQNERAAGYALKAADNASEALAFDRAVRLYRLVLDLAAGHAAGVRPKLAAALASAGRGPESAEEYLGCCQGALAAEKLDYQRRAAEQYLRSGHIDRGVDVLHAVLAHINLKLAPTPRHALLSLLWRTLRVRLRGYGFRERDVTQIAPEELMKIDTCWAVAASLGSVDNVRGADFHKRHLLLALHAGEPYRVARALAIEVGYSATSGNRAARRTAQLVEMGRSLAERVGHPHALAMSTLTAGIASYLEGRWNDGRVLCESAQTMLRERCTGAAWELANSYVFRFLSLYYLGEMGELCRTLPGALQDVQERGDLFAATSLRTRIAYLSHLAADQPDTAAEEVEQAIRRWSQRGFHIQHLWAMVGRMEIALYRQESREAYRILHEAWPALKRSLNLRIQQPLVGCLHHRARCALAVAAESPAEAPRLLRDSETECRRMERHGTPYGNAMAMLVRAGIAATRGRRDKAAALSASSESALRAADMMLYAAAAERRRGEITAGAEGARLIDSADDWMSRQRIRNPARMTAMLAPGRWTP